MFDIKRRPLLKLLLVLLTERAAFLYGYLFIAGAALRLAGDWQSSKTLTGTGDLFMLPLVLWMTVIYLIAIFVIVPLLIVKRVRQRPERG
jgi:hypothetical protein